jgi:hypothetical protein
MNSFFVHPRFLEFGISCRSVGNWMTRPPYPRYPLDRWLVRPQNRCGCSREDKILSYMSSNITCCTPAQTENLCIPRINVTQYSAVTKCAESVVTWTPWQRVCSRAETAVQQTLRVQRKADPSLVEEGAPFRNAYMCKREQSPWSLISRKLKPEMIMLTKTSSNLTGQCSAFQIPPCRLAFITHSASFFLCVICWFLRKGRMQCRWRSRRPSWVHTIRVHSFTDPELANRSGRAV